MASIRLSGADRLTWLQGQVTNDVFASSRFCLCAPNGQIEGVFSMWAEGESHALESTVSGCEALLRRVADFVILEDVVAVALPPGEEGVPRRAGGRAVDNGGPASTSLPLVGGEDSGIASIITIETAGTIFRELECDLMSISPKLRNSTPVGGKYTGRTNQLPMDPQWESRHERDRINIPVLRQLTQRYNYQLKFVVSDPQDIAEIEGLIAEIGGIDPARVFLMPEGVTSEILRERGKWLSPICIQRGWRLGPRLHVDLFGDTKGT